MPSHPVIFLLPAALLLMPVAGEAEVRISGLNDEMTETVSSFLSLSGQPCELNPWMLRYQFRRIRAEATQALESWGYYKPEIDTELEQTPECWTATITISPGPPVIIDETNLQWLPPGFDFSLVDRGQVAAGQRLDHEAWEAFKSRIESIALEKGYFDATFATHEIRIDRDAMTADVDLVMQGGTRYQFGEVHYVGGELSEQFLDRYLTFRPGDPYEAAQLGSLYQALMLSDYFTDVSVDADVDNRVDGKVPVNVYLEPVDPDQTRAGIGYSTDTGARASLSYKNRRLNQQGHRTEASLAIAEHEQEIGGFYRIPNEISATGWTSFYGGVKKTDTDTSRQTSTTIGIRQLVPVHEHWIMTRFIEAIHDDFTVASVRQTSRNYVPGISLDWNPYKTVRRPVRGFRLVLGASGTSGSIGSDTDFVNFNVAAKVIMPLWDRSRIILRGKTGLVLSDNFDELPPGNRYFTGGDDKVRGFDFEALGPRDATGKVIGGNRLLEASIEIDHMLNEQWGIALFTDGGSASLGSFDRNLTTSIGLGVRWYSPIGPVRVDLARPTSDNNIRLHINLGPDL
ncbi:MAG: outer membrane protein assembly factor [Pseudomonadales bacterium]|nr:outer membrane protein assembly factor [Pseudomonadales bacterium]